ncbi:MAG: Lanosterol synthase (Oxidosqualene--lanosterol cyclase) [Chaenotheca gracillima]|nr:MAG: Lanosterol synthase (Oxidosqualene--lanosterol cyclase) [Chaenotheca gracillima]
MTTATDFGPSSSQSPLPSNSKSATTAANPANSAFSFPPAHSFPPFYTLQPNSTTRQAQLTNWSSLILSYARHYRLFKLSLSDAVEWDIFHNRRIGRRLSLKDVREVVEFMVKNEGRAEWVAPSGKGGSAGGKEVCWVWWRKPEEWAEILEGWVEETGQKNSVLTLYELTEGEGTRGTEFYALDPEILQKSLAVLVRRGKAQVFGGEGLEGVKFF